MFRRIVLNPRGENLSLVQIYLPILMSLHGLQNVRYVICVFYKVIYNYSNLIILNK